MAWRAHLLGVAALACVSTLGDIGHAQQLGGSWSSGGGYQGPYVPPAQRSSRRSKNPTDLEMGLLYGTSVAYGAGVGVWLDTELEISDPGVALIAPAILGVGAPVGVYFLDDATDLKRGMPATIAVGAALGGGEGMGIALYQITTARDGNEWSFTGVARSTTLGATLGAVGGYALAYYQEPPPETAIFVGSGAVWGTAIGSMFGFGASGGNQSFSEANDSAALGGLIGYNAGMLATAGLTMVWVPSWYTQSMMWAGAGIGAAASTPVFLAYIGKNQPPAKRGFLFMGTATTLGLFIGAFFVGEAAEEFGQAEAETQHAIGTPEGGWARLDFVAPLVLDSGGGVQAGGVF